MVEVRANHSTAARRALARSVVRWFVTEGMPIDRDIRIIVNFDAMMRDAYGEAIWNGYSSYHARSFTITISEPKNRSTRMLIETLMHELVHVHQMATRRYQMRLNPSRSRYHLFWKNHDHTATEYFRQPWETEAYAREATLIERYRRFSAGR